MDKKPVGKRSLQKPALKGGSVTVGITRKYNVAQYETMDVTVSVTDSTEPGESQADATKRIFDQLKKDAKEVCNHFFEQARSKEL
jgi:hypothetical protein